MKGENEIFLKSFIEAHRHFLALLIFIPLILLFCFIEKFLKPKYIMHSFIDDHIPFVSIFVIPYLSWFGYMAFAFVYLGIKDAKEFMKLLVFIFLSMFISYIIFMLFPNAQGLRPEIRKNDVLSLLVRFIYWIDSPTNVCPSIHVSNSIGVYAAFKSYSSKNKRFNRYMFIWMIIICISTLFIKQHSIIDVICGMILGLILYVAIYCIPTTLNFDEIKVNTLNVHKEK